MQVLSSLRNLLELDVTAEVHAEALTRQSNRRRLKVFMTIFVVVLLSGLTWNFFRPAEYRASARVQINPGSNTARASASAEGAAEQASARAASDLLTQVQVLTSRPLLEKVGESLAQAGYAPVGSEDRAAQLQEMIRVLPIAGTEVVELQATGFKPELLAAALNTLVDSYRDQMRTAYGAAASETLTQAREEAALLEKAVQERRERLDAFRSKHGVLSSEREENEAVAHIKGLTSSLSTANENLAMAEGRMRALRESGGAGKRGSGDKEDPTLAGMELRASGLREELRDMERTYTPTFMKMDPRARALQTRLSELERQLESQRASSQQAALAAAQEDLTTARATVERLQAQINDQRKGIQTFSERFTRAKSLEDDLVQIEKAYREALESLARLEASERSRFPALNLVEAASVPQSPFRPDYLRDALIVLGAAFALGLLAMWFVELFNRQPARAAAGTTVVIPQPWGNDAQQQLPANRTGLLTASGAVGLLPDRPSAPRELAQSEASALLTAATGEARFIVAVLLIGLTTDEIIDLREEDYDAVANTLRVRGSAPRTLVTPAWLAACKPLSSGGPEAPLLPDAAGAAITAVDIESLLACAAFDAGLADAANVTAAALRHTCIAWLVRQGVRFSDLASLVGRPSAEALAFYADLAPERPRLASADINPLMPALLDFAA